MFLEQIARMIAALFVGAWVARYLGPDQFGVFSYAVAFTAIFGTISKLGLDSNVIHRLVLTPEKTDVLLGTAFWLKIPASIITILLIGATLPFTSSDQQTKTFIVIISVGMVFQTFEVVDFFFQSVALSKFSSLCKLVQLLISISLKVYLLVNRGTLLGFVIVTLIDQITLAGTYLFIYRHANPHSFFSHFDKQVARQFIKDSWPLMFGGLVVAIYMRIDQIMINDLLGGRDTGLYSAAVKICEVWYFIPVVLNAALFPAIVNSKKLDLQIYHIRLRRFLGLLVWGSILCAMFTSFFGSDLILLLFGPSYLEALPTLKIHTWAGIFVSLGVGSSGWFINEGLQKIAFYRTAVGAVLNIALNFVLIPNWGIQGAAMATLIAQATVNVFCDLFSSKTRGLFFIKIKSFFPT